MLLKAMRCCVADGHSLHAIQCVACELANSHEEIKQYHDKYVEQGYEGVIIRKLAFEEKEIPNSVYCFKRCSNILKYKEFDDEEVTILDVTQGAGKEAGIAMFKVQDSKGNVLEAVRPSGSFEERKRWFENPKEVIGRRYTIKFWGRSEYGIPRFPVGVGFRDIL